MAGRLDGGSVPFAYIARVLWRSVLRTNAVSPPPFCHSSLPELTGAAHDYGVLH